MSIRSAAGKFTWPSRMNLRSRSGNQFIIFCLVWWKTHSRSGFSTERRIFAKLARTSKLKDKIILITGASSGIGEEAGRQFAREGGNVILCARRIDRLNALAEEIRAAGGRATAISMDVT